MSIRERFDLSRLRRGLANPTLLWREANRLWHTRLGQRAHNSGGIDLFAADWDTLAICDACRADTFAAYHDLPGRLEVRLSRGSSTTEWLHANFVGDRRDTVYVTANPQYARQQDMLEVAFCDVFDISESGWDDGAGTVPPDTVTETALDVADRYPSKRLLVHYIQPHYPFVGGPAGRSLGESSRFWADVIEGELNASDATLLEANRENFEMMLPALADLLTGRDGRTVVSADHGQMFGERSFPFPIREYGHPRQTYTDELVRVPWLIHESGERPQITAGEASGERSDHDDLTNRLEALGYAD